MARVLFSSSAERDAKRLPNAARDTLRNKYIRQLAENPRAGKPLHGPLRGYFSLEYWVDGVSYRIAYEIIMGDVVILMVDTRDNYYKKFAKRVR